MVNRIVLILVLSLCGASLLHGQTVDSTSFSKQGEKVYTTGKQMMLGGAITAAVGGGLMLLATSPALNPSVHEGYPEDYTYENILAPMTYIIGMCNIIAGASFIVAGIPVTVAGHSMIHSDVSWRDARYETRGLGVILEGGYDAPDILQARASIGYHFNSNYFLGAGVAPGFWINKSYRDESIPRFSIPLYANFRWSFTDRMVSPYLGMSAGMELSDITPYLGADLGVRIHRNRTTGNSFWSALSGEVAGGYIRVGVKMGYSFR